MRAIFDFVVGKAGDPALQGKSTLILIELACFPVTRCEHVPTYRHAALTTTVVPCRIERLLLHPTLLHGTYLNLLTKG